MTSCIEEAFAFIVLKNNSFASWLLAAKEKALSRKVVLFLLLTDYNMTASESSCCAIETLSKIG